MITTYFRSSSYNAWDFCELRYFIEYCLGIKGASNAAAIRGTIVHKALELMALQKLTLQNDKASFVDEESGNRYNVKTSSELILKKSFGYWKDKEPHLNLSDKDYQTCYSLLTKALTYDDGKYNPLNQKIISPEQVFNFEIREPWAWFDYPEINMSGYLSLKGTIDLIIENEFGLYEMIDYKTGRPKWDWNKGKEKSFHDLNKDPQLCLYYYALSKLYPDTDFVVTIYYIFSNEPITVMFDKETLKYTEELLKNRFQKIKNSFRPRKIHPNFKCKFCDFSKKTVDNSPTIDYNTSVCNVVHREIQQIGLSKVWEKRAVDKEFKIYSGGGRSGVTPINK